MRNIVLFSGLFALLLAVPGAPRADHRSGDEQPGHHTALAHAMPSHGIAPLHHYRPGHPKAWSYKPGRPGYVQPWPGSPRYHFYDPRYVPRGYFPPHFGPPQGLVPVPLHVVVSRLRTWYPSIIRATRHGDLYVILATDPFERPVEITVDARTGRILERRFAHR